MGMYAVDFEYDGQYLSDYGFIVCEFNYSTGAVNATIGSKLTFSKVPRYRGTKFSMTDAKYDECIQTTFDICKNPDKYDYEERIVTDDEIRDIVRWLNRKEFKRFQVINDIKYDEACFFDATFNIEAVKIREIVYGLRLTMETNRPFGYGQEQVYRWNITDASQTYTIYDWSDEIGFIYPDVSIITSRNGNLSIYNDTYDCKMTFYNCNSGDKISVNGDTQIVTSSRSSYDIYNNFNFGYLKIGNTFENRENKIRVSSPCTLEIKYSPIIKKLF